MAFPKWVLTANLERKICFWHTTDSNCEFSRVANVFRTEKTYLWRVYAALKRVVRAEA